VSTAFCRLPSANSPRLAPPSNRAQYANGRELLSICDHSYSPGMHGMPYLEHQIAPCLPSSIFTAGRFSNSRGNPTVEVDVTLMDGSFGRAAVPAGRAPAFMKPGSCATATRKRSSAKA